MTEPYVYRVRRPGCESLLFLTEGELQGGDYVIGSTIAAQIVQVRLWGARPYAYVWDGDPPLTIGERVVVPPPPGARSKVGSVGQVVGFGTDYPGPLEAITERA